MSSVWCSEPCLQFGIQSHHLLQFGVQSRVLILALRGIVQLGIRCHHLQYRRLGLFLSILGIQSHFHQFQVFRAMSSVWHLKPSSSLVWRSEPCLHFGIQSHCPVWHSVPPSSFSFGVQSRCACSFRHLKSPFFFNFDVQSCYAYSFRHFESPPFLFLAFRVIFPQPNHLESQLLTFIFTGITHLAFMILHSFSFSLPRYLVLIACSSCSSRLPFPLHMTQSFEFMSHISVMLLGTLPLTFSCSSHRATPFVHILSCTPWWFDRYSSLTSIFESLQEASQREPRSIVQLQRHSESYPSIRILEPLLFLCWFE